MMASRARSAAPARRSICRLISTLASNPHIKAFPLASKPGSYLLSYLETNPPSWKAAIGTTSELPPTPRSFDGNTHFMSILDGVLKDNASKDEDLKAQAKAYASPGGSTLGMGTGGAGGASYQGGSGGGGVGGYVHLSDQRNPPDFGRIAWPEDILGSVEVDAQGNPLDNFQPSGTYRIVTNEGILGLSPFLREKLISRLREVDRDDTSQRPDVST